MLRPCIFVFWNGILLGSCPCPTMDLVCEACLVSSGTVPYAWPSFDLQSKLHGWGKVPWWLPMTTQVLSCPAGTWQQAGDWGPARAACSCIWRSRGPCRSRAGAWQRSSRWVTYCRSLLKFTGSQDHCRHIACVDAGGSRGAKRPRTNSPPGGDQEPVSCSVQGQQVLPSRCCNTLCVLIT